MTNSCSQPPPLREHQKRHVTRGAVNFCPSPTPTCSVVDARPVQQQPGTRVAAKTLNSPGLPEANPWITKIRNQENEKEVLLPA